MVRFGFEIAASLDLETSPKYQLKLLNLHEDEEVSEAYLTEVNSKGQVSFSTTRKGHILGQLLISASRLSRFPR
jgi:hypothetical protein